MKSILSAFTLTMFAVSVSFAQDAGTMQDDTYNQDNTTQGTTQSDMNQDTQTQLGQTTDQNQENKTQIAQEELPSEVNNAIDQGEYSDWTVAEAYEIDEQGKKKYEVHFETPEGQTEKETFNESGEIAR